MAATRGTGEPVSDPRVYLAAERTFLAWIRTGLALMGFGFILARFGVFLRQLQLIRGDFTHQQLGDSVWFGVALVGLGVVVNLAAAVRHVRLLRGFREGGAAVGRPSKMALAVAILLACVGIGTAVYLVVVSRGLPAPR